MRSHAYFITATMLVLSGCGSVDSEPLAENVKESLPQTSFDINRCYPYIVPKAYVKHQPDDGNGLVRALGHDLFIMLVQDHHGIVSNVTSDDLAEAQLTAEVAHEKSLANLEKLLSSGEIQVTKYDQGPLGRHFIVIGNHWAAAACILLPGVVSLAQKNLGQDNIVAGIPHRDVMLLFPRPVNGELAAIRKFVVEHESKRLKPLTFGLFELRDVGPIPVLSDRWPMADGE